MSDKRSFNGPVFIVGMPRSGTKLLRGLLNSHSEIGIPRNETECLPRWYKIWSRWGDLNNKETFHAFYVSVTKEVYFQSRLREHGHIISEADWYLSRGDGSLHDVFRALVRNDVAFSTVIWGDKSPGYLGHLQLLKRVFPQARIIHIVRDVRDYVLSMRKAFGKSGRRAAQRWVDTINQSKVQSKAFEDSVVTIRYEDLLSDTEGTLRTLCTHLDIEFESEMLKAQHITENIGDTKGAQTVIANNSKKYLNGMTSNELGRIEGIAGELLKELGYPVHCKASPTRLPQWQINALQIYDGVRIIQRDASRNGILSSLRFRLGVARHHSLFQRD